MRSFPTTIVVLLLHVLFFGDVLLGGRSLSPATFTSGLTPSGPYGAPPPRQSPPILDVEGAAWVDEPSPHLATSLWRAGELPLWTPAEGLGAPLAANLNSGAGNPLHLPLALWPDPFFADVFALARLLLLALGTAAYLTELTLAPVAVLAGVVVMTYGGYVMAWIVHHPLSAELFLPLMLAGVERGRRGATRGWALVAVATAGSLVGGKLQASLLCLVLVGVYAALRGRRAAGGADSRTATATAAMVMLGVALAGYLLLPAAEMLRRASGLTLGGRSALAGFTLPWPTLAAIAAPRLFVPPDRIWAEGLPLPPSIGVAATILATVGVCATRSPVRGVARLLAVWAALLLARNAGLFGGAWITGLPVVRGIFFLKYTFTVAFALAVLAAIGVDAVARGLVGRRTVVRAGAGTLAVIAGAAAFAGVDLPGWPGAATLIIAQALCMAAIVALWWAGALTAGASAALLALAIVVELRILAPAPRPPRLDPYRRPPYVEFLRAAPSGRVLAADALMPPLTSGAAGLRDLRAINVLTPDATYAFFTRLVSFCSRVIHFTVDPNLPVAATAAAIDLVGVRYVVSRGPLDLETLDAEVARQVGRERVARLLSGLRALRVPRGELALAAVASADDERFAFSLLTPFTLELEAESEAPELAWGLHVDSDDAVLAWRVDTIALAPSVGARTAAPNGRASSTEQHAASAEPIGRGWRETRVPLGVAGSPRRVRLRIDGESPGPGRRARVALGDLGFSEGAAAEQTRRGAAELQHRREAAALSPVFIDRAAEAVVYENRNAMPRAFRVTRLEAVASTEAALTRLADGFDFRSDALVTASDATLRAAQGRAREREREAAPRRQRVAADAGSWSATTVVKDDPGAVTIATVGAETALVVLADLAFPGWQATIDGEATDILESDGVLRGVLVPPGPHCIEYRYVPGSWRWGLLVSAAAGVLLLPFARAAARTQGKIVPRFPRVV